MSLNLTSVLIAGINSIERLAARLVPIFRVLPLDFTCKIKRSDCLVTCKPVDGAH
jgi:hypothetical protein